MTENHYVPRYSGVHMGWVVARSGTYGVSWITQMPDEMRTAINEAGARCCAAPEPLEILFATEGDAQRVASVLNSRKQEAT